MRAPGVVQVSFNAGEGAGGGGSPAASDGASGAAPAASSAPADVGATTTVTTRAETASLKDNELPATDIFEALGLDHDDRSSEEAPGPVAAPEEPQETPQPATTQQTPTPPQQTQESAPPAKPDAAPPPQAPEPTTPPSDKTSQSPQAASAFSEEVIAELEKPENRDALIGELERQLAFTPEELNGLATDAPPVLQRALARVLYASSVYTLRQLQKFSQEVPRFVSQHLEQVNKAESHMTRFHTMWPQLKDPKYTAAIEAAAQIVRKMPGITQDGLYSTVGRMVMAQFGLSGGPIQVQQAAPTGQPQREVARQAAPFTPAATGAGPSVPSSRSNGTTSPWDGLGLDFDS